MTKPYPPYEAIGLVDGDGYKQLATSLLQIENEFYSPIRPKRVIRRGERPIHALRERGVQYVEARVMDLDPFEPIGIGVQTMKFLDVFLLHCLLAESPPDTPEEVRTLGTNKQQVASRGREPGLRLDRGGEAVELRQWAGALLDECAPIAAALDAGHGGDAHRAALSSALRGLDDPEALPSARVLKVLRERYDGSFSRFVLAASLQHRERLRSEPLPAAVAARYAELAEASLEQQRQTEAADAAVPFETFRQRYLSPESLVV
jgi:glutamate--cysteine ligase